MALPELTVANSFLAFTIHRNCLISYMGDNCCLLYVFVDTLCVFLAVGHTEIEAANSYTQTDKPVPSMLWARHLWRRFQKEIPCAKLVHFTDSCRTLAYVVDRTHHVLGRSCGFSVATCQSLWYSSHVRRRWDQGGKRWLANYALQWDPVYTVYGHWQSLWHIRQWGPSVCIILYVIRGMLMPSVA